MEKLYYVLPWILIIAGALITFFVKPILEKKVTDEQLLSKYTYIFKIVGMWLVVIGAVIIFILGGSFGGGNQ